MSDSEGDSGSPRSSCTDEFPTYNNTSLTRETQTEPRRQTTKPAIRGLHRYRPLGTITQRLSQMAVRPIRKQKRASNARRSSKPSWSGCLGRCPCSGCNDRIPTPDHQERRNSITKCDRSSFELIPMDDYWTHGDGGKDAIVEKSTTNHKDQMTPDRDDSPKAPHPPPLTDSEMEELFRLNPRARELYNNRMEYAKTRALLETCLEEELANIAVLDRMLEDRIRHALGNTQ